MKIKPHGMSEQEMDFLVKNGIKYDKRKRKQLLAAFHDTFRPTRDDLEKIFSTLNIRPPEDYLEFLIKTNGGKPEDGTVKTKNHRKELVVKFFYSAKSKIDEVEVEYGSTLYAGRIPSGMLPIAHDPAGNIFLLGCQENLGQVYFWDHEGEVEEWEQPYFGNMSLISNSFSDFIQLVE